MSLKIAVITPIHKRDYLTEMLIDGLSQIDCEYKLSNKIDKNEFIRFAKNSDLVIFCWGKNNTDRLLANEVNEWHKTVYLDGSELGGNRRYDEKINEALKNLAYDGQGAIDLEMLGKTQAYFRREKPYSNGIIPFPFSIGSSVIKWNENIEKDVDFFCVFGQDEFPLLRRYATEEVKIFCKENNFSCITDKLSPEEFHNSLARSKVGVSVGGGGFDTVRFWEILGNNCLLMTETIDIYPTSPSLRGASPDLPPELNYSRITQFKDLEEFKIKLKEMGEYLRKEYSLTAPEFLNEYKEILNNHSSKARAKLILQVVGNKGII